MDGFSVRGAVTWEGNEMPEAVGLREYVCPQCGRSTKSDSRFVAWCIECGHGADPYPPKPLGKRGQRDSERERRRSTSLFESLRTAPNLRPTSATGVAVTLLSGFVHLIGLALLVLPIVLVVNTHGALLPYLVLGLCLLTFCAVRPRLVNKRLDSKKFLTRPAAPELYALLDKCAAELGCKVPDAVHFDKRFNAATGRAGVKQRPFGAPSSSGPRSSIRGRPPSSARTTPAYGACGTGAPARVSARCSPQS